MSDIVERLRAHDLNLCGEWVDDTARHAWMDCADSLILEAADRIEELERQLERRTVTATLLALEVAAKVAETLPSNTGMYLDRRDIAKAIRAISDSAPTLLQEQKDNAGKEEG